MHSASLKFKLDVEARQIYSDRQPGPAACVTGQPDVMLLACEVFVAQRLEQEPALQHRKRGLSVGFYHCQGFISSHYQMIR